MLLKTNKLSTISRRKQKLTQDWIENNGNGKVSSEITKIELETYLNKICLNLIKINIIIFKI